MSTIASGAFPSGAASSPLMRAVLDRQAPGNADRYRAEGVLRLLGLSPQEAAEVAHRPMPQIPSAE
jgi:hypothetical protein